MPAEKYVSSSRSKYIFQPVLVDLGFCSFKIAISVFAGLMPLKKRGTGKRK